MKNKKKKHAKISPSKTGLKGGFSINIEFLKSSLYWFTFGLMLLILGVIFVYFLRNSRPLA
jgi:bacteriorhodopsin